MEDDPNDLFAIEVDTDDYAETAAEDTPAVPRTYQSEAAFQDVKAAYSAKNHTSSSSNYDILIAAVPVLRRDTELNTDGTDNAAVQDGSGKVKLSKKDFQLLGYVVGQWYFHHRYAEAVELCERVTERCAVDAKMEESLGRWIGRCTERLAKEGDQDVAKSAQKARGSGDSGT